MPELADRVAIVTGSSRGIGRAIALRFASAGCRVVINYRRSRQMAQEAAREVGRRGPGRSLLVQADVSLEDEARRLVADTVAAFGRLDILVNNAGIGDPRPFLDIGPADWDRMLAGNLTSAFLCARAALPPMLEAGWGRIINIASTSGLTGGTSGAHYAAAKGGLIALTRALSSEFAPRGVTVNAIVPGKIETDLLAGSLDAAGREALLRRIPVGRLGRPEEVAGLALYLASEEAGYVTGEALVIAGGYR